jgi:VanZ family protein
MSNVNLVRNFGGALNAGGDEIYQTYIPKRTTSMTDVLLDVAGIVLTRILVYSYQKRKRKKWTTPFKMKLI